MSKRRKPQVVVFRPWSQWIWNLSSEEQQNWGHHTFGFFLHRSGQLYPNITWMAKRLTHLIVFSRPSWIFSALLFADCADSWCPFCPALPADLVGKPETTELWSLCVSFSGAHTSFPSSPWLLIWSKLPEGSTAWDMTVKYFCHIIYKSHKIAKNTKHLPASSSWLTSRKAAGA